MTTPNIMAALAKQEPSKTKLASGIVAMGKSYNADPARITFREGWNNRFDMGELELLADGIHETLKRTPSRPFGDSIGVKRIPKSDPRSKDFDFEVIYGHRRTMAAHILLERGVVFPEGVNIDLIDKDQDDLTSRIAMINENNKKPLSPMEEAIGYKALRDVRNAEYPNGMSIAQICKAVGRTDVHVRETLALLDADEELQEAVKTGKVAGSTAKTIVAVSKGDKAAQKELVATAKEAKGGGKSAKAAKAALDAKIAAKRAANAKQQGKEVKIRPLNADQLAKLGQQLAKHLEAVSKEANFAEHLADQIKYREMVSKDEKLAAAYVLGAFQALQAAAGVDVDLMI